MAYETIQILMLRNVLLSTEDFDAMTYLPTCLSVFFKIAFILK